MRWKIINKHNLSEKMKKMQEEAIKQARDAKAKSCVENNDRLKNRNSNFKKKEPNCEDFNKDNSKNEKNISLIDKIFSENENALIIILIILLMDDEKNFLLLLVLLYLLM